MRPILSVILAVFFSGCASTAVIPEAQMQGSPHMVSNVPFFPQEDYQCGPSSLAAVLNYWGVAGTPDEIAKTIYSPSARGTLSADMTLYAEARGLEALQYRGGWDDLRDRIDSGQPVIVLVDYGFSLFQINHFMVVIGYDDDRVVVNSGKEEMKVIHREDFLKAWRRTNFWTLLIKRKT